MYRLFSGIDKGFYIDIGAADHSLHSVTACFYMQGWRGINVEPVAESYSSLCQYRPEDTNLNVAVAESSDSLVEIAVYGDSPGNAGHHRVYTGNSIETPVSYSVGGQAETRAVDATTLRTIFDRYVGSQPVNFLKIDIEGKEFDALQSLDLPSLPVHQRPQVILLEVTIPFTQLDAPHREPSNRLLESNNYKHLFFDGLNDYYCESSLFDQFKPLMLPPSLFDKPSFLPGPGGFGQLFTDREIHAHQLEESKNKINQLNNDVERLSQQLEAKEVDLKAVINDRNSQSQKNETAQQQLTELQQQLAESQQQLAESQQQLAESQQQFTESQQQLAESQQQLIQTSAFLNDKQSEAKAASEKAELTLRQLHQAQEELEHYFHESRARGELVKKHHIQQHRIKKLMSTILIKTDLQTE